MYVATEDGEIGEISYNRINKVNVTGEIKEISEDLGIETVLLSGDGMKAVQSLQAKLGFNRAIAGATPEYKAEYVKNNNAVYARTQLEFQNRSLPGGGMKPPKR